MKRTIAGVLLALPLLAVSAAPPSAEEYYAHAVAQMRAHAEPAFATYDATVTGGLSCAIDAKNELACTLGGREPAEPKPFAVALRESDQRVALLKSPDSSKGMVLGDSTFFNPTWPGVDEIIRRGFTGQRDYMQPHPAASPGPATAASTQPEPPVIAVVSTFSADNYRVYDEGPASCMTGAPGHAVRLVARRDPMHYPLTQATIDVRTGDLCSVHFNARIEGLAGVVGATGGARLDIQNVAGYDVVTNERFDIDLRAIGIAVKHVGIDVAFSGFAFPKSMAPDVFATPPPAKN